MADLLLELFSEEIPARMQAQAAKDLERLVIGALSDRGLLFEAAKAFSGPRRLTLAINGLPAKQPDVSEEKKGPRINAPEKAIEGFLRSAGVTLDQCEKRDDGKGEFYVAVISRKGRDTAEVLAEVLPETFAKLPWPKSMRWPGAVTRAVRVTDDGRVRVTSDGKVRVVEVPVRWVRPLHGVVCTLDGEVVPFEFAGVKSGDVTYGHRFLSQGPIEVRRFEDYEKKLQDAYVILDPARRKEIIWEDAKAQAFVYNLEPIPDEGLLEEVSGLAEWPVVLTGKIENEFMDVPAEILQTSMRTHQKYFSTRDPKTGKLANRFIVVANMVAQDGGKEIVAGNERVLRARLSDAKFFWDQDRKQSLKNRIKDLKHIVFHAQAGTMHDRAIRIAILSMVLADLVNGDIDSAERAGLLAKADLTTGVVGEFPELQGTMGRYYALHGGETSAVADAVRDHYKPLGPNDVVPAAQTSYIVALADKIDTLVSLWHAGEKPTGSKDPFALRRAGLGIIRIVLENKLRLSLLLPMLTVFGCKNHLWEERINEAHSNHLLLKGIADQLLDAARSSQSNKLVGLGSAERSTVEEVLAFLADRLEVALRDRGVRHDLIAAVFALGLEDDLVRLVARVEALQKFLGTEDGANLLTAYRRGANILKAEEKKDSAKYSGDPDPEGFVLAEEKSLYVELATAAELIRAEVERERFVEAMGVMARLRKPVDAFFDKVTVNDKDPALRKNRLLLLSQLRATLHLVADFSKIEG